MLARTIFILLLVLILLFTFGPALIAVGSEFIAEGFGCKSDLNRVVPCVIGGKDYGETIYDLGFLIWYSYLTLPVGALLVAIWAVAALIVFLRGRRTGGGQGGAPSPSPGRSFLRGAAIAILLALSPIFLTYAAGFIALRIGCDLNEVAEHPCMAFGMNVGPPLATLSQTIWFIALTAMAGLLALIVLFVVWIVRVAKARRARVDGTAASP